MRSNAAGQSGRASLTQVEDNFLRFFFFLENQKGKQMEDGETALVESLIIWVSVFGQVNVKLKGLRYFCHLCGVGGRALRKASRVKIKKLC